MDMKQKIMIVISIIFLAVSILLATRSLGKMFPKKNSEVVMDSVEEKKYLKQQFPNEYN